jgi:hypothetical protein
MSAVVVLSYFVVRLMTSSDVHRDTERPRRPVRLGTVATVGSVGRGGDQAVSVSLPTRR